MNEVTRILSAIEQGDPRAGDQLLPLVYEELRKLAAQKLAQQAPGQTLQATALVHVEAAIRQAIGEAYRSVGVELLGVAPLLMLDETIVTETPPLYAASGHLGEQVRVPITGNRAKRILYGAINVGSGEVVLLITEVREQEEHQAFLSLIRSHWRGWHIVLFEDRNATRWGTGTSAPGAPC
jgi:hypothetical protein